MALNTETTIVVGRLVKQERDGEWLRASISTDHGPIAASTKLDSRSASVLADLTVGAVYEFVLSGDGKMYQGVPRYYFSNAKPTEAPAPSQEVAEAQQVAVVDAQGARERSIAMQSCVSSAARFYQHRIGYVADDGKDYPYTGEHLMTLAQQLYQLTQDAAAGTLGGE